jgi:protein-tyrosine-phosphatase
MDFIFTLCDSAAAETCPIWPGHPASAHWGLPDPALAAGSEAEIAAAFEQAYGVLNKRIERFVALPLDALEGAALGAALRAIGEIA